MKKKIFFFLTFLVFLTPSFISAQEDLDKINVREEEAVEGNIKTIGQIKRDIKKKEYNLALEELHDYIRKYPNRFDNAEKYVRLIFKRREKYSSLFEELVKTSNDNPEDFIACGEIITQMKEIEKNPPSAITELFDSFVQMYFYQYNAYLFRQAQEQAAQLADAEHYVEAVDVLKSRFNLYEDDFHADWDINEGLVNEVEKLKEQLLGLIDQFGQLQDKLNADTQLFVRYVDENNYAGANGLYPEIQSDFTALGKIRNEIQSVGKKYRELYRVQKAIDPDITDASYLSFMQHFVNGPVEDGRASVVSIIDSQWNARIGDMKNAVAKQITAIGKKYDQSLPEDILGLAEYTYFLDENNFVKPLTDYSGLGERVNDLNKNIIGSDGKAVVPEVEYNDSLDYIAGLSGLTLNIIKIADDLNRETEIQKELFTTFENNKGDSSFDSSVYIQSLFDSISRMSEIIGDKEKLRIENQNWSAGYLKNTSQNTAADGNSDLMNWKALSDKYTNYIEEVSAYSSSSLITGWKEVTGVYKESADIYADQMKEYIQYADVYHKGFSEPIDQEVYDVIKDFPELLLKYAKENYQPTDKDADVKKYPELTAKLTDFIQGELKLNRDSLTTAQKDFETTLAKNQSWKTNTEVAGIVKDSGTYIAGKVSSLDSQDKETAAKSVAAKKDYEIAVIARDNGDALLAEAESLIKKLELDDAQELLEQAMSKYAESLKYMYDANLEEKADNKHKELIQKIRDGQNESVVINSRKEYEAARTNMQNDNYDEALSHIQTAKKLWAKTHNDTNSEYEDLYVLINTAINLQKGRELLPSDPLYAEMSQILNKANLCYDEGVALYNEGRKAEGNKSFNKALEHLEKIKKIYPFNNDVALLKLKIEQVQNPETFAKTFKEKIAEAEKKCKNKDPNVRTEGYNDLLSYQLMEPNNKDLKNKIYNIEIELGMRERPVDNSGKARAARLVTDAQKDIKAGKRQQALSKLNQALALDPTNATAKRLKDNISIQQGAQQTSAPPSLNASQETLYQQALAAYQSRNYDTAYAKMTQLLAQNPNAIRIEKVQNLKTQIDAKRK